MAFCKHFAKGDNSWNLRPIRAPDRFVPPAPGGDRAARPQPPCPRSGAEKDCPRGHSLLYSPYGPLARQHGAHPSGGINGVFGF